MNVTFLDITFGTISRAKFKAKVVPPFHLVQLIVDNPVNTFGNLT